MREYRKKNKSAINQRDRSLYRKSEKFYIKTMLNRIKHRAKQKGIPFNLTESDIQIPKVCPVLGIELKVGDNKGPKDQSPSLDRIIPSLGYVKGNVAIISYRANMIKSNANAEEIRLVLEYVENKNKTTE